MHLLLAALLLQTIPPQITDKSVFLTAIVNASTGSLPQRDISGITVPHHLLARDLIAKTFALASRGSYKRVVVMSPDHNNLGETDISLASGNLGTVFGEIETDQALTRQLTKLPQVSTSSFFYREHGVQSVLPFIKYYFPHARAVAIAFKASTRKKELDAFIETLETALDRETLIVQSTDFSHYLPAEVADVKDAETIAVINSRDPRQVFSLGQPANLDSIAAQYAQMRLQKDLFGASPRITGHKNSQEYSREKLAKTTSYITQVYLPRSSTAAIIAVGDIMLGRSVESLMNKHGADYPFQKLSQTLGSADAVVGNLEGPIHSEHIQTPNASLTFSFSSATSRALAENHFAILALANNHAYDFGETGFEDTRRYLANQSIAAVGHPRSASPNYAYTRSINGRHFSFVSLNATSYFDEKAAAALVATMRKDHRDTLLIVLIHWGDEYKRTANDAQRSLAHKLIDNGADLIIGSHPHVVQGIESYKDRLVFYSLGNFIFDQYFSRETQEGLMLKLEVADRKVNCRLIPIASTRSQPQMMASARTTEWLADLSSRSSASLKDQIVNGAVAINAGHSVAQNRSSASRPLN